MSGPKSYSPPPRYSIAVFNGKLNEIFQLQCRISSLTAELSKLSCTDPNRGIQFDCSGFLDANRDAIRQLTTTFTLEYEGTFGQEIYDKFERQVNEKIKRLNSFIEQLNEEKEKYLRRQDDYQSYIAYEEFYTHTIAAFLAFKNQVLQYLESYLKSDHPELYEKAKTQIEAVEVDAQLEKFEFGFREKQAVLKKKLKQAVEKCEEAINAIRLEISENVSDTVSGQDIPIFSQIDITKLPNFDKNKAEVQKQIEKINAFISQIEETHRREHYQEQLTKLIQSETFKDVYFYIELYEDIKEAEKTYRWKREIQQAIADINKMNIHQEVQPLKNEVIQLGISLIAKERLKLYEIEDFQARLMQLKENNQRLTEEEFIREKERQFLKAQLVKTLENMGYEVMTDMEIIDFEKESDFVLKIPNQPNYLNLRFNEDGSFLYTFLIPERREDLSIDQKRRKLSEMDATCQEFKSLLRQLAAIGLRIDLKEELPVSENVLVQVPQRHRSKIKTVKPKVIKKEIAKKKYLKK